MGSSGASSGLQCWETEDGDIYLAESAAHAARLYREARGIDEPADEDDEEDQIGALAEHWELRTEAGEVT